MVDRQAIFELQANGAGLFVTNSSMENLKIKIKGISWAGAELDRAPFGLDRHGVEWYDVNHVSMRWFGCNAHARSSAPPP